MKVLKWYSIIVILFVLVANIHMMLISQKKEERTACFISLIVFIPIIFFIINS